eukprot:12929555-Prorocentrum_lima.AAC.1
MEELGEKDIGKKDIGELNIGRIGREQNITSLSHAPLNVTDHALLQPMCSSTHRRIDCYDLVAKSN